MSEEDAQEVLLSDLPDSMNPYKNYWTVSEMNFDDLLIRVTTNSDEIQTNEADRLINNAHVASTIANKINGGPIRGYHKELTIRFPREGLEGLMLDLNANRKLLSEDDDSQTAAVIHELIHGIQENEENLGTAIPQEAIPLAAEFIFSGETRKPFFIQLTQEIIEKKLDEDKMSSHPQGWKKAIQLISAEMDVDVDLTVVEPEDILGKINQARLLKETDKVALVRKFLGKSE